MSGSGAAGGAAGDGVAAGLDCRIGCLGDRSIRDGRGGAGGGVAIGFSPRSSVATSAAVGGAVGDGGGGCTCRHTTHSPKAVTAMASTLTPVAAGLLRFTRRRRGRTVGTTGRSSDRWCGTGGAELAGLRGAGG